MISTTYKEVEFQVACEFIEYRPASYLQPAEGGYYDIHQIYYNGIIVTDLFNAPNKLIKQVEDDLYYGNTIINELAFLLEGDGHFEDFFLNFNNQLTN
jgi:hypothetical protein